MRHRKLFSLIFIAAATLLFTQCTTEPIPGPPGQDGVDGVDGIDGIDGATGTTECASCHNIATTEQVHASYLYSMHSIETKAVWAGNVPLSQYANRSSCTLCHTKDGYTDYTRTGMVTGEPYPGDDQKISCSTCHEKHTTFDFENEGYDYALRSIGPVTLLTDETYAIDYQGTSNTCAVCHQPRRTPPVDDGSGMFEVYNHWGPHHGPQSTFLEGIQGAELTGSESYPGVGSATHRTGSSCTSCHMGESSGEIDGHHTMIPTPTACTTCHSNGVPSEVAGLAEDMATLEQLLEEIGIIMDGHEVPGVYSVTEAQAAWNYLLVNEDQSMGIHNPAYARALVKNSIETLNAQ